MPQRCSDDLASSEETKFFTIFYFGFSFSGQMFTGQLQGTLNPLKQVYNPTKIALIPSPGVDWLQFLVPGETF